MWQPFGEDFANSAWVLLINMSNWATTAKVYPLVGWQSFVVGKKVWSAFSPFSYGGFSGSKKKGAFFCVCLFLGDFFVVI